MGSRSTQLSHDLRHRGTGQNRAEVEGEERMRAYAWGATPNLDKPDRDPE